MASENNIIEQLETEKQDNSFDASAFVSSEVAKEVNNLQEESTLQVAENEQVTNEKPVEATSVETEEKTEVSNDFDWDEIKVEEKPVAEEQATEEAKPVEEEDWDSIESPTTEFNWNEVSQEIGVEAKTKEEFVAQVKDMIQNPIQDNDTITNLQEFLKNDDVDLVRADLKAANHDEDYIEDTLTRLQDAGLMKREATQIRTQLQKYIGSERAKLKEEKLKTERELKSTQEKARKDLQNHIKSKKDFFGGKVSVQDKKELYSYITKGDFSKEIFDTHANVAEAAFLWKNKDKIFKMMKTRGVEQGKSSILDNITAPSKNARSSNSFETKSEGFDAKAFLS